MKTTPNFKSQKVYFSVFFLMVNRWKGESLNNQAGNIGINS